MRTMCFAVISAKIQEPVISGVDKFAPVGVDALGRAYLHRTRQVVRGGAECATLARVRPPTRTAFWRAEVWPK